MEINSYNTYSILSSSQEKNNKEIEDILKKAEKMCDLTSVNSAKSFIKDNWNIEGCVKSYFLAPDCFLNIRESNKNYVVNFVCKTENISYYFNK